MVRWCTTKCEKFQDREQERQKDSRRLLIDDFIGLSAQGYACSLGYDICERLYG